MNWIFIIAVLLVLWVVIAVASVALVASVTSRDEYACFCDKSDDDAERCDNCQHGRSIF